MNNIIFILPDWSRVSLLHITIPHSFTSGLHDSLLVDHFNVRVPRSLDQLDQFVGRYVPELHTYLRHRDPWQFYGSAPARLDRQEAHFVRRVFP